MEQPSHLISIGSLFCVLMSFNTAEKEKKSLALECSYLRMHDIKICKINDLFVYQNTNLQSNSLRSFKTS